MLTEWALDRNTTKHGYRIAELAGCPLEPYADLLHCLRSIDQLALRNAQKAFSVRYIILLLVSCRKCVELIEFLMALLERRPKKWKYGIRRPITNNADCWKSALLNRRTKNFN